VLTSHAHLAPNLKMSGFITLHPSGTSWNVLGYILYSHRDNKFLCIFTQFHYMVLCNTVTFCNKCFSLRNLWLTKTGRHKHKNYIFYIYCVYLKKKFSYGTAIPIATHTIHCHKNVGSLSKLTLFGTSPCLQNCRTVHSYTRSICCTSRWNPGTLWTHSQPYSYRPTLLGCSALCCEWTW